MKLVLCRCACAFQDGGGAELAPEVRFAEGDWSSAEGLGQVLFVRAHQLVSQTCCCIAQMILEIW